MKLNQPEFAGWFLFLPQIEVRILSPEDIFYPEIIRIQKKDTEVV